jgi:protein-S-isoprenylcysteine O-methyltransferase Ste14
VLAACWVAWVYPFLFRARRVPGRRAAATDRRSMWGLALETAAVLIAWFGPPAEPGAGRIAAALALAPLGPMLAWSAVEHLGRQWRIQAGLWHDHRLVRTGPYRVVRHPIFASILPMLLATALLRTTWPAIALALALYLTGTEIRVRVEDRLLASRFGAEFAEYRRRVRAYVPMVR